MRDRLSVMISLTQPRPYFLVEAEDRPAQREERDLIVLNVRFQDWLADRTIADMGATQPMKQRGERLLLGIAQ
jgi:hypothetical protein